MAEPMSVQGPVLKVNGELMLLIPLEDGGAAEVEGASGVCDAQGSYLKVAIPEWIAGLLRIEEGDLVSVSSEDGELPVEPGPVAPVH
jgi:hypothetical protein